MIEDLEALLREVEEAGDGELHFVIVYDISKAHRLVPVREADWGLQAFQLTGRPEDSDEVIMYSCGTFGIASAAYWWARVSAAMVLLLLFCLGLLRAGGATPLRGLRLANTGLQMPGDLQAEVFDFRDLWLHSGMA